MRRTAKRMARFFQISPESKDPSELIKGLKPLLKTTVYRKFGAGILMYLGASLGLSLEDTVGMEFSIKGRKVPGVQFKFGSPQNARLREALTQLQKLLYDEEIYNQSSTEPFSIERRLS